MQEEFPSDKHRGDNEYQTAMSRLNEVRLEIDFSIANSELRYAEKIQKVLHEIGGEDKFSRSQRIEFVKSLIRNIGTNAEHRTNPEQLRELHTHLRAKKINRINKLLEYILRWIEPIRNMWNYGEKSGWFKSRAVGRESYNPKPTDQPAKDRSRRKDKVNRRDKLPTSNPSLEPKSDMRGDCRGCGRRA